MKIKYAFLAAALTASTAFAATTDNDFSNTPALSKERLSGALQAMYETNYNGRGYVVSHSVAQGDSYAGAAMKLSYDVGKKGLWSFDFGMSYKAPFSGHTLYGAAPVRNPRVLAAAQGRDYDRLPQAYKDQYDQAAASGKHKMPAKNVENEWGIMTTAKYTRDTWNITMGHDYVHGGLLGVMAKHFRGEGASCVNEIIIAPEWTPAPWFAAGVTTRFSISGVHGWWFEPYITLKAPIVGTPDDIKVAGVLTFAMSATADYFDSRYNACENGAQAFWIKFSTPWFVKKNFIITPSVSFNWLGKGGMAANQISEAKHATLNDNYVPFREFGVVGGISMTYTF